MLGPTIDNLTLTDDDVRAELLCRFQEHLSLEADGYRVDTEMLFDVLVHAAATGQSIEASCDELLDLADANTIRGYLNAQFDTRRLNLVEHALNAALCADLPRRVRRAPLDIACDEHDQPFYGKTEDLVEHACRGRAKAGTTRFFRIASAYIIRDGVRITLAVAFVHPDHHNSTLLHVLLDRIARRNLRIGRMWLDRGYATVAVLDLLNSLSIPAVVACPIRGKPGGNGTRALCVGRRGYLVDHTFRNPQRGPCTVMVAVVRAFLPHKGKRRARWMVFALLRSPFKVHQVRELYRRRFGIETSYRQMRQVRIKTNTRNPALRFVYLAIALLIVNVWTLLRFRFCQIPRRGRGGRAIDFRRFTLPRMASFLRHAVERRYEVVRSIQANVLPLHAEPVVH